MRDAKRHHCRPGDGHGRSEHAYLPRLPARPPLPRHRTPSDGSLEDLAEAIVGAFGFDFDHAFGFYSNLKGDYYRSEERYELFADLGEANEGVRSVRRTKLGTAFPEVGKKMLFLFDYGDQWLFTVELIGLGWREPKAAYPRVVKQVGEAPPQYPALEDEEG